MVLMTNGSMRHKHMTHLKLVTRLIHDFWPTDPVFYVIRVVLIFVNSLSMYAVQ